MSESGQMFAAQDARLERFRGLEREQISLNRYYLGEKMGHFISWEYAEWDFVMAGHRERWVESVRMSGLW